MLPPAVAEMLEAAGHSATTPFQLGAHNLPEDVLIQLAAADGRVIVTENASDFAGVTTCLSSSCASRGGPRRHSPKSSPAPSAVGPRRIRIPDHSRTGCQPTCG